MASTRISSHLIVLYTSDIYAYFCSRRVARRMGRFSGVLGGANRLPLFSCCGVAGAPAVVAAPVKLNAPPLVEGIGVACGAAGLPNMFPACTLGVALAPNVNGLAVLLLCGVDEMPPNENGALVPLFPLLLLLLLALLLFAEPKLKVAGFCCWCCTAATALANRLPPRDGADVAPVPAAAEAFVAGVALPPNANGLFAGAAGAAKPPKAGAGADVAVALPPKLKLGFGTVGVANKLDDSFFCAAAPNEKPPERC